MILQAGNFDPKYKHSEDEELGERLIAFGYKSIGDPALITFSEITNSLSQVLERHWRWHVGKDEKLNLFRHNQFIQKQFEPNASSGLKSK